MVPEGVFPGFPNSMCTVSTQLKTQLEQTEATLEGEQALRQKLSAELEEVRPYPCSSQCARARGDMGQGSAGQGPSSGPAPHPCHSLLGIW